MPVSIVDKDDDSDLNICNDNVGQDMVASAELIVINSTNGTTPNDTFDSTAPLKASIAELTEQSKVAQDEITALKDRMKQADKLIDEICAIPLMTTEEELTRFEKLGDKESRPGSLLKPDKPDIPKKIVLSRATESGIDFLIMWEQQQGEKVLIPSWMKSEYVSYLIPDLYMKYCNELVEKLNKSISKLT